MDIFTEKQFKNWFYENILPRYNVKSLTEQLTNEMIDACESYLKTEHPTVVIQSTRTKLDYTSDFNVILVLEFNPPPMTIELPLLYYPGIGP